MQYCARIPFRTEILILPVGRSKAACHPKFTFDEGSCFVHSLGTAPDMSPFLEKTQSIIWWQFGFIGPFQFSKWHQLFLTKINTYSMYKLSFLSSRPWPVQLYKNLRVFDWMTWKFLLTLHWTKRNILQQYRYNNRNVTLGSINPITNHTTRSY